MLYQETDRPGAQGLLAFDGSITHREPKFFYLNALVDFFRDPHAAPENPLVYTYYEKVCREGDESRLREYGINHNYKVIQPGCIGREYLKTMPHLHPRDRGTGETWPELHEVQAGEGLFLLHPVAATTTERWEALAIAFVPGVRIRIRSGYAHTIVNTGPSPAIIGSLISRASEKDHEPLPLESTFPYTVLSSARGLPEFEANPVPGRAPALEISGAPDPADGGPVHGTLYESFLADPDGFAFLWK